MKKTIALKLVLFTTGVLITATALPQDTCAKRPAVLFDLTADGVMGRKSTDDPTQATRVVALADGSAVCTALQNMQFPIDVEPMRTLVNPLLDSGTTRLLVTNGDDIDIFTLTECAAPQITPEITRRQARIVSDTFTLAQILLKPKPTAAPPQPKQIKLFHSVLPVKERRSDIKLTATTKCAGTEVKSSTTLVTGPAEHLSLSADLPVSNARQLKLDDKGTSLVPKDNPRRFYIGLDYSLGDLLTERTRFSTSAITLKAMVLLSKNPSDSYGAAIAYKLPKYDLQGFDLSTLSIFGGYFWTKSTDASGSHQRTNKPQIGVSFDLKTALGWLKQ